MVNGEWWLNGGRLAEASKAMGLNHHSPFTIHHLPLLKLSHLRVEGVAQAVAEEVEGEESQRHRHAGEYQLPREDGDVLYALLRETPPRRVRRLHAQAEERKERLLKHDRGDGQRRVDDDGAERVRNQVAEDYLRRRDPGSARREDELLILERDYLPAHDARHRQPRDRAERREQKEYLFQRRLPAEEREQHDDDHHVRNRVEHVNDSHHQVVRLAAEIARGRAPGDAYDEREEGGDDADHERDAAALKHAREHVAARGVRAHRVQPREVAVGGREGRERLRERRVGRDEVVRVPGRDPYDARAYQHPDDD